MLVAYLSADVLKIRPSDEADELRDGGRRGSVSVCIEFSVARYAFPHTDADERRRLELLEERLDPITIRRIERLELAPGARCLEVGGGRGSIASLLCERVGRTGHVIATDLETDFLAALSLPNLEVLRHDVTTDEFPERSFDFVHARAVLMHIGNRMGTLRRMVSWLAPGGWLLVEEADFGL